MRTPWRFALSMLFVTLLFFAAAVMTLRAAEPGGRSPSPSVSSRPSAPVAPPVPEESATVTDDPTTAPDAAQSADNAVSFPTDI